MTCLRDARSWTGSFELRFIDTLRNGRWSLPGFVFAILRIILNVCRARTARDPVIVHLNVSTNGSTYRKWFVACLCKVLAVPFVVHLHGGRYRTFFANSSPVVGRMVLHLFNLAERVIVLGDVWREFVIEELKVQSSNVSVVPNGTPPPAGVESRPVVADKVRIVFSGRLSVEKGVRDLLVAADRLHADGMKFELALMGDSRDSALLEEARSRQYTIVTGWLNQLEVLGNLATSDIFVLPSHDEGLPMSMIEAMSLGLPLIVTDVGTISDVITDGREGYLLTPGDIDELTDAIKSLLTNADLRERMGAQAKKRWSAELTAEGMAQRIGNEWNVALVLFSDR